MTNDDFKQFLEKTIRELDLINRPYALICNPAEKGKLEVAIKETEFEEKVVWYGDSAVEVGKVYLMKRESLEDWAHQKPDLPFQLDTKWANNSFGYTWSELE